ncbi:MAG: hypothetical protein ACK4IX_13145, partial [Candidatus Sericytochromatia bacterium]
PAVDFVEEEKVVGLDATYQLGSYYSSSLSYGGSNNVYFLWQGANDLCHYKTGTVPNDTYLEPSGENIEACTTPLPNYLLNINFASVNSMEFSLSGLPQGASTRNLKAYWDKSNMCYVGDLSGPNFNYAMFDPSKPNNVLQQCTNNTAPLYANINISGHDVRITNGTPTCHEDPLPVPGTYYGFAWNSSNYYFPLGGYPASPKLPECSDNPPTNPTLPTTPVLATITTTGVQGNWNAVLDWSDVSGSTSYKVYKNGNLLTTVTNSNYTDSALSNSSNSYYIQACNSLGCSTNSNTQSINSPSNIPSIPNWTSTNATGVQGNWNAVLDWSDSPTATSYKLYKNGNLYTTVSSSNFNDTSLVLTPASYYVQACNSFGCSNSSTTQTLNAPSNIPSVPTWTTVKATGTTDNWNAVLDWSDVSGVDSYKVYKNGNLLTTVSTSNYSDSGLSNSSNSY